MAVLTGLAAAEVQERAIGEREQEDWLRTVDAARQQLPDPGSKLSLEDYLRNVMRNADVDLIDAKRALSHLRALHDAVYKFGEGVSRSSSRR